MRLLTFTDIISRDLTIRNPWRSVICNQLSFPKAQFLSHAWWIWNAEASHKVPDSTQMTIYLFKYNTL